MNFNSEEIKELVDYIDKRINQKVPTQVPKYWPATVISVGAGNAVVHLPTDVAGTDITVQNSRELPLEIGDEINLIAINGDLSNAFVDIRKNITLDNIYVDYNTGVDSYGYNNAGNQYGTIYAPFKTLQYAVNRLPKFLNNRYIWIHFDNLNALEDLTIRNFSGGHIYIVDSSYPVPPMGTTSINSLTVENCNAYILINYLQFKKTSGAAIFISYSNYLNIYNCAINDASNYDGIYLEGGSFATISACNITNRGSSVINTAAINVVGNSSVFSFNNTGNNSGYGIRAVYNSTVGKIGTQCTGTAGNELVDSSSEIR
jgi:hypothetical protein